MSYPKWKYHKTEEPKLVLHEEQEEALGSEWVESPAEFQEAKEQPDDLSKLSAEELRKVAAKAGFKKAELKDLSDAEIIELIKGKKD